MNLKTISEKINIIAANNKLELFSIKEKEEHGIRILEILLDGSLDSNNIEAIHHLILDAINDDMEDGYYLEVSSVGAERPIRDASEMKKVIGSYINISSDHYSGDGTLVSFDGEKITINVNQKGRFRNLEIMYEKINNARLAIKF